MAGLVLLGGYYYPSLRGDVLVLALQALPVIGDVWHHTFGPFVGRIAAVQFIRRSFAPHPVPAAFRSGFPLPPRFAAAYTCAPPREIRPT